VNRFQYVQGRITDMKIDVEQLRGLCASTMGRFVAGGDVTQHASIVKLTAQQAGIEQRRTRYSIAVRTDFKMKHSSTQPCLTL